MKLSLVSDKAALAKQLLDVSASLGGQDAQDVPYICRTREEHEEVAPLLGSTLQVALRRGLFAEAWSELK